MREAYVKVVLRCGGAGGAGGMQVSELDAWLNENYDALVLKLVRGKYEPQPVRRAEKFLRTCLTLVFTANIYRIL